MNLLVIKDFGLENVRSNGPPWWPKPRASIVSVVLTWWPSPLVEETPEYEG